MVFSVIWILLKQLLVVQLITEKEDQTLLSASTDKNEYEIVYQFPYQDSTITATTKIFYCNYQSYLSQVICVDEYITDDDEMIKESVLERSKQQSCKILQQGFYL